MRCMPVLMINAVFWRLSKADRVVLASGSKDRMIILLHGRMEWVRGHSTFI
jgi:hypothetical protein